MGRNIKAIALHLAEESYQVDVMKRNLFGMPPMTFETWLDTEIHGHRYSLATEKDKRGRALLYIARNYWNELLAELNQTVVHLVD